MVAGMGTFVERPILVCKYPWLVAPPMGLEQLVCNTLYGLEQHLGLVFGLAGRCMGLRRPLVNGLGLQARLEFVGLEHRRLERMGLESGRLELLEQPDESVVLALLLLDIAPPDKSPGMGRQQQHSNQIRTYENGHVAGQYIVFVSAAGVGAERTATGRTLIVILRMVGQRIRESIRLLRLFQSLEELLFRQQQQQRKQFLLFFGLLFLGRIRRAEQQFFGRHPGWQLWRWQFRSQRRAIRFGWATGRTITLIS